MQREKQLHLGWTINLERELHLYKKTEFAAKIGHLLPKGSFSVKQLDRIIDSPKMGRSRSPYRAIATILGMSIESLLEKASSIPAPAPEKVETGTRRRLDAFLPPELRETAREDRDDNGGKMRGKTFRRAAKHRKPRDRKDDETEE